MLDIWISGMARAGGIEVALRPETPKPLATAKTGLIGRAIALFRSRSKTAEHGVARPAAICPTA